MLIIFVRSPIGRLEENVLGKFFFWSSRVLKEVVYAMEMIGLVPKAGKQQRVRHPVMIDPPGDVLSVELIVNRILIVKVFVLHVHTRRHFDVTFGGACVNEKSIWPG